MKTFIKIIKFLLVLILLFLIIRYFYILIIIWGIIEIIIWSISRKTIVKAKTFICNFVITVLSCIDTLTNIILQVPANRILLITKDARFKFGSPKKAFTTILRMNFFYNNLKLRGVILYNIIAFFKKNII